MNNLSKLEAVFFPLLFNFFSSSPIIEIIRPGDIYRGALRNLVEITGSEICKSGDIYDAVLCGPTDDCGCCTRWCELRCAMMLSSVSNQSCTPFINPYSPTFTCECCCESPFPSSPSRPPPPPSPPPPPPTPSLTCQPGDIYDVVLCGPTENCACCARWCELKMCHLA
ncbi:hypothetical protein MKW92_021730 [Papaver armeniacum]|nr:hypothetical protein MKW92_021730 [Papaver armeniacum]